MMDLTRRELLTLFLGAPFAFAACESGESRVFPDGEIVGQSVTLGHLLRENRTFDVPADRWETKKVAIIGGGVAGLTAAWKFKKDNFNDFVLLELEKEIGGTARSGQGGGIEVVGRGAHRLAGQERVYRCGEGESEQPGEVGAAQGPWRWDLRIRVR